ncbi:1-carboxy-3-chloro-3,4-dihydroxycyclo hexa-1,5-diene dehydrogenase [Novosphingobium endophyticum]|uniref:1-carboxy-3-chloro-3,4-dihydroxycyclo hexa-1,5-diene dehydrogenase n=1 Tax=Novosphingobium endophyticum TaxID=1955250 RepID=A0A916X5U7_9SPHN|nr:Gfo/Idh/MocA family oxidoreductase [Novosphingobium endophyticum]GGC03521.1 1-carboxy-3-chloro-3,4-dihydroxycyclo hexa-1,5-diene dehydrogenase [Novosphingobium endophyticum]
MTDRLRVGIISANWSLKVHGAAWRRIECVEVAAICTSRQETAERAAREYDIPKAYWNHEEMSADPDLDIIDVGTRPSFRFPMVMAALRNGKHVYDALPFAVSTADAEAMRDAQLAAGVVGTVDAQFRWSPPAQQMKAMIDSGFIGRPLGFNVQLMLPLVEHEGKPYAYSACSEHTDPYYWLAEKSSGGSAWRNFATHGLLFLTHLIGPVEEATGMLTTGVPEWFLPNGEVLRPETHDLGSATLRMANGAIGSLQAGWCVPDTEGWRVEIWGDRGRLLLVDNSFGNLLSAKLYAGDARLLTYGERTCREVTIDPAYYAVPGTISGETAPRPFVAMDWMFSHMADAIRNGREGSPSFTEAAAVHRVVEAVELANAERRWVRIAQSL